MKRFVLFGFVCAALFAQAGVKVEKDISYVTEGDQYRKDVCKLDIMYPDTPGFSTFLFIHGGGLEGGGKYFIGPLDRSIAQVTIQYRFLGPTNNVQGVDCIKDAAEAVAWTLKNIAKYGGDPKKVYVGGLSAGAYLTLMIGMDPEYLAPYGYKPTDLAGLIAESGQATTHYNVRKYAGDTEPTEKPKIDKYAPLAWVSKDLPPILSLCGEPGYEIPERAEENKLLIASLQAMGHPWARFVQAPLCNHYRMSFSPTPYVELFIKGKLP